MVKWKGGRALGAIPIGTQTVRTESGDVRQERSVRRARMLGLSVGARALPPHIDFIDRG